MATEVRLVVYDTLIARMSLPGGRTYQWVVGKRRRIENAARAFAPVRTGELKASIRGSYVKSRPNHVVMHVTASAEHALYVHEGTGPWIRPTGSKFLRLKPGPNHPNPTYREAVRGQRANPFLANALDTVMRGL
jgi:hypothetical protein